MLLIISEIVVVGLLVVVRYHLSASTDAFYAVGCCTANSASINRQNAFSRGCLNLDMINNDYELPDADVKRCTECESEHHLRCWKEGLADLPGASELLVVLSNPSLVVLR